MIRGGRVWGQEGSFAGVTSPVREHAHLTETDKLDQTDWVDDRTNLNLQNMAIVYIYLASEGATFASAPSNYSRVFSLLVFFNKCCHMNCCRANALAFSAGHC